MGNRAFRLRRRGFTVQQIADLTGWDDDRIVDALGDSSIVIEDEYAGGGGGGGGGTVDSWHTVNAPDEPGFVNGWSASLAADEQEPQFKKDSLGWVCLRGRIVPGANATVAFTLPEGYRPPNIVRLTMGSSQGSVTVFPDGTVIPNHAGTVDGLTWLDHVRFEPA